MAQGSMTEQFHQDPECLTSGCWHNAERQIILQDLAQDTRRHDRELSLPEHLYVSVMFVRMVTFAAAQWLRDA